MRRAPQAALVALPLAALALVAGCADAAQPGQSTPSSSVQTNATASPSPEPAASQTEQTGQARQAEQLVRAWLTAARDSETETVRAGLGAYSLLGAEATGGLESMTSGLAEGVAAFLDAQHWTVTPLPDRDGAFLVVASGDVTREGTTERAARSWLVHPEGGRTVLEAFSPKQPELVAPQPGSTVRGTAPVDVFLPFGQPTAVVDGVDASAWLTTESADGDQVRVRVVPPAGWSPGGHVVAVAVTPEGGADTGAWASVAVLFDAG